MTPLPDHRDDSRISSLTDRQGSDGRRDVVCSKGWPRLNHGALERAAIRVELALACSNRCEASGVGCGNGLLVGGAAIRESATRSTRSRKRLRLSQHGRHPDRLRSPCPSWRRLGAPTYLYSKFQVLKSYKQRSLTIMPNFIPLDPSAHEAGYHAGRRGLTDADNPYPVATREAIAWVIGFMKGRSKRLQIVDNVAQ